MSKKRIVMILMFALVIILAIYLSIIKMKKVDFNDEEYKKENYESDINGKGTNNEEYLYKEELLTLGYKIDEINTISKKISDTDVKDYLLSKKYDDLTSFIQSPYFDISKIEKYQEHKNKVSKDADTCIMEVEIGIDKNFYTGIIKTDTSKNELMLVNKYYALEETYTPNLVKLDSKYGSGSADKEAYEYFKKMVDDASIDGIKLKSVSFYRSYSTQKSIYNNYKKRDGEAKADTYSARPGHSEHQTGLGVDINTASSSANFENTKEYKWLINNSYKYGYILRYPNNKTYITGYKYEPWHYRYVGIEAATKIFENDITYEEYYVMYILRKS